MAYLYTAKITTIFETTKFVAHNFLFNVSAIIALQKKIRDLRDFKDFKDLRDLKDLRDFSDKTLRTFFLGGGRALSRGWYTKKGWGTWPYGRIPHRLWEECRGGSRGGINRFLRQLRSRPFRGWRS